MSKRKALVTGITGQDGAYLAKFLLEKDYRVYGLVRKRTNISFENLEWLGIQNEIELVTADLTDYVSLRKVVKDIRPWELYNLAAQSFVGVSWEQPIVTYETNIFGPLYLLESIREVSPITRFYQASTSEMFGKEINENGEQNEETRFHPRSPYGVSKCAAHWTVVNYRESYNLYVCCGILFNHESPLRGKEFVTRKITDGLARIRAGLANHIELGNLDAYRDWGFAGDYVKAMWMMLQADVPDDYVVATGEAHSVREFLELAHTYSGLEGDPKDLVVQNPLYMRPAEVPYLKGDPTKIEKKLGWKPETSFESLVRMMMEADLGRYGVK